MSKDPAFLFYFRDFLVSTELMTFEEIGQYIKILCHMADKGRLSLEDVQSICKAHGLAQRLHNKFKIDEKGFFYNERLEEEVEKRRLYSESRRLNAKHMHKHMGNANINEDKRFKINEDHFETIWDLYPNKDGKKIAFRHFKASVSSLEDIESIKKALNNYLKHLEINNWKHPKSGSTWFNNWQDWVNWKEPERTETDAERDARIIAKIAKG